MARDKIKLYLAGPWFNSEQDEREQRIKKRLRELGFEVFSPREASELKMDASIEDQDKVYRKDILGIVESDAVFAITNGKDMGTIWEAGFACGMSFVDNQKYHTPVIYFAEGLDGPFNLMLARSGLLTYTNLDDVTYEKISDALSGKITEDYKGEIE